MLKEHSLPGQGEELDTIIKEEASAAAFPEKTRDVVQESACGKAILVGEHAVIYGAQAVAMPVLNMQVSTSVRPQESGETLQDGPLMYLAGKKVSEHLLGVVEEAADLLKVPLPHIKIDGVSSVLIGAGLGSSAAICVVVLKTLAAYYQRSLSCRELSFYGNLLEKRFHGSPSGLDTSVVAFEQVIQFRKGHPPTPLDISPVKIKGTQANHPWRFALIDSGLRSSTLTMIEQAAPWFQEIQGDTRIARFDHLAAEAIKGLEQGDCERVAFSMNEAGSLLEEAGIVGDPIKELIDLSISAGAVAAKVTGAGGGGCILALLPEDHERSLNTLNKVLGKGRVHKVELL